MTICCETILKKFIELIMKCKYGCLNSNNKKFTDMAPVRAYSEVLSISSRVFSKS